MASALNETGFSEESIRRNPAADLEGGTFFRVSDSSVSRVGTLFFRLLGGRSTPMAGSSKLCESVYTLNSGRTVSASDAWPVIIAAPLVQVLSGHCSQWTKRAKHLLRLLNAQEDSYAENSFALLAMESPWELQSHTKLPVP